MKQLCFLSKRGIAQVVTGVPYLTLAPVEHGQCTQVEDKDSEFMQMKRLEHTRLEQAAHGVGMTLVYNSISCVM